MTRRDSVLREMGLAPIWRLRGRTEEGTETVEAVEAVPEAPAPEPARPRPARSVMPQPVATTPVAEPARASAPAPDTSDVASLDWDALEARIAGCTACPLCTSRQKTVPGMGDRNARVMFIGEGPGAEEDRRGLPFVGAAGKMLDAMLASIGLSREQGVYIANTVKCRPPRNRTPENAEMAACRPFLERQIALVRPRLLVALGRPAAQVLLDDEEVRIKDARGRVFEYGGVPVRVTYHPAYLLRNPADKARAWEDLCAIRKMLEAGD